MSVGRPFRAAALAVIVTTGALAACNSTRTATGGDAAVVDVMRPPAADASKNADATGDEAATTGDALYVSAETGSDANEGRSPRSPRRTIASTLLLARASHADVRVCAGTYPEKTLVIATNVVLRGGYDCSTWSQTAAYGWPTFDRVHETIVRNADGLAQSDTLYIHGEVVTRATLVDGITFEGAAPNVSWGGAARIDDRAMPTLSNDRFLGGDGPAGAAGLIINGLASPDVSYSRIVAGHGAHGMPAIGLAQGVEHGGSTLGGGGSASIHHNAIYGLDAPVPSSEARDTAVVAVFLAGQGSMTEAGGNPFAHNFVDGGFAARRVSGVHVMGEVDIDLVDNDLRGARSRPSNDGDTRSQALNISEAGTPSPSTRKINVLRNRIFGGVADLTGGIAASDAELVVANNMIHGGRGFTLPLAIGNMTRPVIAYNTIYQGTQGPSSQQLEAAAISGGIITNNIFLGHQRDDSALRMGANFFDLTFTNNLLLDEGAELAAFFPDGAAPTTSRTVPALENAINAGGSFGSGTAHGNVTLPSRCAAASKEDGCLADRQDLFGTFSIRPDDGLDDLFGHGWHLRDGAPCIVTHGGAPLSAITTDLYGMPRSITAPSIGAHEHALPCTP